MTQTEKVFQNQELSMTSTAIENYNRPELSANQAIGNMDPDGFQNCYELMTSYVPPIFFLYE